MAALSGITKDSTGALASKLVRVYKRSTGDFVGATLSNATTGAWSITTADTSDHFAVMNDAVGDPFLGKVVVSLLLDSSLADNAGHTFAATGGAAISSVQSAFGTKSLSLDGVTKYLSCTSADFDLGAGDFTIEAFVYFTGSSDGAIVGKQNGAGADQSYNLKIYSNGAVSFQADTGGAGTGTVNLYAGSGVTPSVWSHVAVERQGSYFRIYVGGVLRATSASFPGAIYTNTQPLLIGSAKYLGSPGYFFGGYLNGVRITKGVARYGAAFTPPTTPYLAAPSGGVNALVYDLLTPV